MSQHDMVISNDTHTAVRADLNAAFAAIVSNNSGASEPSTTYAYEWWADTTTGLLKIRNAANTAWVTVGTLADTNLGLAALAGSASQDFAADNLTVAGAVNEARGTVAMHATTMDLWAQPNIIDGTGSAVTITAIANAPQAGARRVLYPIAATVITNGATFAVEGAANYTTAAGDALEFEAVTTSTYNVWVKKANGSAVVGTTNSYGTITATTGGTSIDFTNIPDTATTVGLLFYNVSTNGTSFPLVQIGDAGGVENTGYVGCAQRGTSFTVLSAGAIIDNGSGAGYITNGKIEFTRLDATSLVWQFSGLFGITGTGNYTSNIAGTKALSAGLDRIRLTTVNGTDTFDAGSVNVYWM